MSGASVKCTGKAPDVREGDSVCVSLSLSPSSKENPGFVLSLIKLPGMEVQSYKNEISLSIKC